MKIEEITIFGQTWQIYFNRQMRTWYGYRMMQGDLPEKCIDHDERDYLLIFIGITIAQEKN